MPVKWFYQQLNLHNLTGKGGEMGFFDTLIVLTWGLTVVWILLSIKVVDQNEMAVRVIFGKWVKFWDSGLYFLPWFFGLTYLKRYPKGMYQLNYKEHTVVSKAGTYPANGIEYGSQVLRVDSGVYLSFPREPDLLIDRAGKPFGFWSDYRKTTGLPEAGFFRLTKPDGTAVEVKIEETHPLIKIFRAGVPIERNALQDWTEEAVVAAVRVVLGNMTWKEAMEDREKVNKSVMEIFTKVDGALIKAGFRPLDISLVIHEIKPPDELAAAFIEPDKARLKRDAMEREAEMQAIDRIKTVLYTMALSRGVTVEEIQAEIKKSPELQKEFQHYAQDLHADLEKADRGAYFKFDSPGAEGIDKGLQNLVALFLGGILSSRGKIGREKKSKEEEKKEEEEKKQGAEETSNPSNPLQSFWRQKKPMEKIHQWRQRKKGK